MISLFIGLFIFGVCLNRNNFIVSIMLLELLYLVLGLLLLVLENQYIIVYIIGVTATETVIGMGILLGYYSTLR